MVLLAASLSPRENETFVMYIGRDFNDFGCPARRGERLSKYSLYRLGQEVRQKMLTFI